MTLMVLPVCVEGDVAVRLARGRGREHRDEEVVIDVADEVGELVGVEVEAEGEALRVRGSLDHEAQAGGVVRGAGDDVRTGGGLLGIAGRGVGRVVLVVAGRAVIAGVVRLAGGDPEESASSLAPSCGFTVGSECGQYTLAHPVRVEALQRLAVGRDVPGGDHAPALALGHLAEAHRARGVHRVGAVHGEGAVAGHGAVVLGDRCSPRRWRCPDSPARRGSSSGCSRCSRPRRRTTRPGRCRGQGRRRRTAARRGGGRRPRRCRSRRTSCPRPRSRRRRWWCRPDRWTGGSWRRRRRPRGTRPPAPWTRR